MKMTSTMVYLEGKPYHVEEFPYDDVDRDGPLILRKGIAYRYETCIASGLYPYRGIIDDTFSRNTAPVGFYAKRRKAGIYELVLVRPRTKKEAEEYAVGREKDIVAATMNHEFSPDEFLDNTLNQSDIGTDVYRPPIHTDDDPLNLLMKIGIREKHAPFDPYGKRLEALAVNKSRSVEGNNNKNNVKRGLRDNRAMSASKFHQLADTWQFDAAFVLKDIPGAMHPLNLPEGYAYVSYLNGIPFDIDTDKLINITDLVAEALAEQGSPSLLDEDSSRNGEG